MKHRPQICIHKLDIVGESVEELSSCDPCPASSAKGQSSLFTLKHDADGHKMCSCRMMARNLDTYMLDMDSTTQSYYWKELLEALDKDAQPSFTSYLHMMCFLHTLTLRPLFGLPSVNHEDAISKHDACRPSARFRCTTSGQQHDAKHIVAELAMKYHPFLLEGYELWDLVLPKNE